MERVKHVILSGGVGSRLWPLSRKSCPKQYIKLFNNKSLFELTVERNLKIANEVIVVGNVDNSHLSIEAVQKLGIKPLNIIEATPRNTAAAIAFAAFASQSDDILLITPSDHIIHDDNLYESAMRKAINLAELGNIVTFGINPTKPETGYGYIEYKGDNVSSFREKPNKETAEEFIESGSFLWNSGMFCFRAIVFLEELKQFEPKVYEASKLAWKNAVEGKLDIDDSKKIPSISVDYAVMERSKKIKVVKSFFGWSDLGSFEAVYDHLKTNGHEVDENGNMVIGTEIYTSFLGLKNTIFVHTKDANLILRKENAQEVKKIYSAINKMNSRLID